MKKYWTLFWKFRDIELQRMLEYRGSFYFWTIISLMWTFFNFFFFTLLAGINGGIGGWSEAEIYVLMSIFTILDAFTWSFFYQNMREYTDAVYSGKMTMLLTKPVDTQYMLMTQTNSYNNVMRFFVGVGLLVWSLGRLDIMVGLFEVTIFIASMLAALTLIYFLWFIFSTFAFWAEKMNNINNIIPAFRRIWQVPRSVYSGFVSVLLTMIIPLGLIVSVPSEALLGKAVAFWLMYLAVFALGLIVASRLFFSFSVKRFSGVGN